MDNKTKLTQKMYKTFLRRHSKISFIIIRVCYCLLFVLGLLSLIVSLVEKIPVDIPFLIYCGVFSVLFVLYDIFYPQINSLIVKDKNLLNCDYYFTFNEESFEMIVKNGEEEITKSSLKYSTLYNVKKFDDVIYIYLNRINAYIVDLNSFTSEENKNKVLQLLNPYINMKNKVSE